MTAVFDTLKAYQSMATQALLRSDGKRIGRGFFCNGFFQESGLKDGSERTIDSTA